MKETLFRYRNPLCDAAHSTTTQNLTLHKFLNDSFNIYNSLGLYCDIQDFCIFYFFLQLTLNYGKDTMLLLYYSLSYETCNVCLMFSCVTSKGFLLY